MSSLISKISSVYKELFSYEHRKMVFKWTQPKQTSKIEDKIKNIVEDANKERHLRRQRRVSDVSFFSSNHFLFKFSNTRNLRTRKKSTTRSSSSRLMRSKRSPKAARMLTLATKSSLMILRRKKRAFSPNSKSCRRPPIF